MKCFLGPEKCVVALAGGIVADVLSGVEIIFFFDECGKFAKQSYPHFLWITW